MTTSNTERHSGLPIARRRMLTGMAAAGRGSAGAGLAGPGSAFAQSTKTGTVRVWGEPGPYGGVAVAAMNEWAQKNAPGLKFEIESIPWDGVYVKLMTDLAAKRPPSLISVESPIAMQLMAEGLLTPVDDLVDKIGRNRLVDGVKWEYWGAWKGQQFVVPAHHQPHLLLVRMDIAKELGLKDPDTWDWNDLLNAAKTISQKKPDMAGFCMALGRNLCTDYHFAALLHSAGGRMFDAANKFEVAFDSPQTVEALTFVKELQPYMPKGAVEYSFLQVVDAHVTGRTAMSFYWGRTLGRAAEEAKPVFEATEAFNHARQSHDQAAQQLERFPGLVHPGAEQPVHRRGQAGARLPADQQGLADQVLPLADAERGADLHGHRRRAGAQGARVLQVQATHGGHLLQGVAGPLVEHRQRTAAGRQPAGRHRAWPLGARADRAEGRDRQHEAAGCGEMGRQGAERHSPRKHPPARLATVAGRLNSPPGHPHGRVQMRPGHTLSDRAVGLLFIAPFVTAALFFMVYPIAEAIRMAFYSYNPLRPDLSAFVGLANFEFIFRDPLFWDSFRQATVWTFLSIVFQTVFGVAIAHAAASGAGRHRHIPRPAAVSLHRADGGDRPHLALDLQSGDRRGELRACRAWG